MSKIDWKGDKELMAVFSNSAKMSKDLVGKVVKNNAEKLMSVARAKAPSPHSTGFLKSSIKTSYPNELEARINAEASYAGYQEWGTRFQSGTPFMRPAFQEIAPKFKNDMENVVKGMFK